MPQALLPIIPAGTTEISDILAVQSKDGYWNYFFGFQPVFRQ